MDGEERIHDRKSFGCSGSKKQTVEGNLGEARCVHQKANVNESDLYY